MKVISEDNLQFPLSRYLGTYKYIWCLSSDPGPLLHCGPSGLAFLVGEYTGGPRLAVTATSAQVPHEQIARSPRQRQHMLAAGCTFIWCTLAALAGTQSNLA
eukprot:6193829-Pleurochrysis_carterae.AAC.1